MKLDAAFSEYSTHITMNQGKSPRTVSSYLSDLKEYFSYLKQHGIEDTDEITSDLIDDFIHSQQLSKQHMDGRSPFMRACL